jgi:predicted nuclease of restriction endonuclease-like RecB superfamily
MTILPFEHIRVFRRKGVIKPIFVREPLGILETLIEVFRDHKNKKRADLNEAISDCEHLGYNYKLVRGVASILESRSIFQSRCIIPPQKARREVFTEAAKVVIASNIERLQVLTSIANRNGITVEELEDSLYADLEDEQYLIDFLAPSIEELMRYYNYSHMISLLAYSLNIEITYKGSEEHLEKLVRRIKGSKISGKNRIKAIIDLKPTNRLNYRASKLDEILRIVTSKSEWSIKANIKYPQRYKTYCIFEISNRDDGKFIEADNREMETIIRISNTEKKDTTYDEIIVLDEVARRQGVTTKQILNEIKKEEKKYIDLGDVLVSPSMHEEISSNLQKLSTVGEAQEYLKSLGVRDFLAVIESYGYYVEWSRPRKNSPIYHL